MDKIIKAAFGGAVALSGLFVLAVQGRTGHPGLAELKKWKYAHRGLHDEFLPENSMLKDGNLAVMHDSSLKRTTGCDGCIEDLTTQQLKDYHLGGTDETIPEFRMC